MQKQGARSTCLHASPKHPSSTVASLRNEMMGSVGKFADQEGPIALSK